MITCFYVLLYQSLSKMFVVVGGGVFFCLFVFVLLSTGFCRTSQTVRSTESFPESVTPA